MRKSFSVVVIKIEGSADVTFAMRPVRDSYVRSGILRFTFLTRRILICRLRGATP